MVRILCVMDNVVSGNKGLEARHGLSLYLEAGGKKVLFDFGQGKEIAASAMKLDNLYPYCQAGDYLYAALYDEKSQKYVTGFLALESLAEGEGGFISVGN